MTKLSFEQPMKINLIPTIPSFFLKLETALDEIDHLLINIFIGAF